MNCWLVLYDYLEGQVMQYFQRNTCVTQAPHCSKTSNVNLLKRMLLGAKGAFQRTYGQIVVSGRLSRPLGSSSTTGMATRNPLVTIFLLAAVKILVI